MYEDEEMKKTLILVVVLAALVAIWLWLSKREEAREGAGRTEYATQADTLLVSKVIVSRHNQPDIVLEKDTDGFWNLTAPLRDRANPNIAKQLVRGIALMVFKDKVTAREAMQSNFEIDPLQGAHLQAFQGDQEVADLWVGKMTPDRIHVYARRNGSDDVFTATGGSAMAAFRTRPLDDFRDRQIFSLDLPSVDSLSVTEPGRSYTVARVDTMTFRVRSGKGPYKPADRAVTESVLRGFVNLSASGFAADTATIDWTTPALSFTAWLLGKEPVHAEMQPVPEETSYYIKVDGKPHVYKVYESAYKTLSRDPKALMESS